MKMVDVKGFKIVSVDVDYKFFQEEIKKLEDKGKLEKANTLKKLLNNLDEEQKKGKEINADLIEEIVNRSIAESKSHIKELKKQIKDAEAEINMLCKYSQKEQDDGAVIV